MIFDRFTSGGYRYPAYILMFIFMMAAGYFVAASAWAGAALCIIAAGWLVRLQLRAYGQTHEAITLFFNSLRNEDTSLQFPEVKNDPVLAGLYEGMNKLNRHFQEIRIQHEYNEKYYQALVKNSATGFVVLNEENQVELVNEMACRFAGISAETTNPNLLKARNPEFFEAICLLQPGKDHTYRQVYGNSVQWLLFKAIRFQKGEHSVKLISIQDIRRELESREIESYKKLISVLTHEIMNLLSPLNSVSGTLNAAYHPNRQAITLEAIDEEILKTTLGSIEVINEQTTGLMNFVNNYRKLSKIPAPEAAAYEVNEWLDQLRIVYASRMREQGIEFEISADKGIREIIADKKLINQVIINLVNNAVDAVNENEGNKCIRLSVENSRFSRIWISVSNNGPIIPPDIQDKIFVPFFTTKKEGSGIGLSICQEIMKLHQGSLILVSGGDMPTTFTMEL
jgi:two-component system, NtrC family, nitrogen regulation sensor histidine kinase NtrY